jgi:Fe-S cluster assembly scaffold protein SufB
MSRVATRRKAQKAPAWAGEMEAMLEAYRQAGGDPEALRQTNVATLVVSANQVLAAHEVPGINFQAEQLPDGVKARIAVQPGARIEHIVHLCFGMLPAEGVQRIIAEFDVGAEAQVEFLAHCTFPNAVRLQHLMEADIHAGANAYMSYSEEHYHGKTGGIEVRPHARVTVDEGGRFFTTFNLSRGRIGVLDIDYLIDVAQDGVVEMTAKAYGSGDDEISVRETLRLNGARARGLAKTRVAVRDRATSHVFTTAEGNAPGVRGHMDCTEIVRDQAVASNTPMVVVRDDQAHITHEAAIGSVNSKELETLLARGLDEDEAVDIIIRGMLK